MSKKLLLLGGNGQLGKVIVNTFKSSNYWKILSLDFKENKNADDNFLIDSLMNDKNLDLTLLHNALSDTKYDAIVNVAGGWMGHSLKDNNILSSFETMFRMNTLSTVLAGHLATSNLKQGGLLVFTGANAVKEGQNWVSDCMLGYQISKLSVHNLTDILIQNKTLLPKDVKLVTILPSTIDTESNRKAMPDSDFTKWTKPEVIATTIKAWAEDQSIIPNESFIKI